MPTNRRYTDEEMRALIQRATELQAEAGTPDDQDLTLREIEVIAADLGLDPRHLHAAARELSLRPAPALATRRNLFGAPFRVVHERIAPGPLTDAAWDQILAEIRAEIGGVGRVTQSGPSREWVHALDEGLGHIRLSARTSEGGTHLHLSKRYHGSALVPYVLGPILTGTLAGIFLDGSGVSDPVLFSIFTAAVLSALVVVRLALGTWSKQQEARFAALADRLQDAVVVSEKWAALPESPERTPPHLALPDPEAATETTRTASPRVRS